MSVGVPEPISAATVAARLETVVRAAYTSPSLPCGESKSQSHSQS